MHDKESDFQEKTDSGEVLVEEVNIEECAKKGEQPPLALAYLIRVDKQKFAVHEPTITGDHILKLAGKTAEKFKLYQHKKGHQPQLVAPHETVDLRNQGVERFTTMAKDTTEGRGSELALRKEFKLPQADEEYLNSLGLPWETARNSTTMWLFIHDWKVPAGYNLSTASLALLIPAGYADLQIDMVYFNPALSRTDGQPIKALANENICGESWQRWSRHRTGVNPWRVGVDDVSTHLTLVDEWLHREVGA